ncbi:MAG TPA: amidohydrolase family protein [Ignavibacteriaceae bacterium]|nr:amidohydrolase family protein [Ignavibacteriaceae bacterium]
MSKSKSKNGEKILIIPKRIVTVDTVNSIIKNKAVEIIAGKISSFVLIDEIQKDNYSEVYDAKNLTLIPGFIQTHVHLSQTLFRGLAEDLPLLEWLRLKIFPFENAHNKESLRVTSQLSINELLMGGTTTFLDMGTLRHGDVVLSEMVSSGIRGFSGKCLIDINDIYPDFKSSTKDEIKDITILAESFHNSADGRVKYSFSPRFVLSCTEKLLKETKEIMKDFPGSIYHTHSSESLQEIDEVRKRFHKENIEYFDSISVLDDHTVLAHCAHTSDNERKMLKDRNTRIAHCPSANMKLGSGIAPIPQYLKEGILVTLGADGAPCNNNLSIFNEMRLASLIQKPVHGAEVMDAKTIFRMATIDGAKALHLQDEVGSIEVGKKADLVLIDLDSYSNSYSESDESIYSDIVFSSTTENVRSVMVDGRWLVKERQSTVYDQEKIVSKGKEELNELLQRL